MEERYDILYAGGVVDGFDPAAVRDNVGRLFKANEQTLVKLFSGKPQMIKRGVDKPAAIKYKAAMQKAGAVALIRLHKGAEQRADAAQAPSATASRAAASEATEAPQKPVSMAERLAALTGDSEGTEDAATPAFGRTSASDPASEPGGDDSGISIAPAGSDVLRDDERASVEEPDIDTSAIQLAPEFSEPTQADGPAPAAPDVSHLSMGDVGESIPHLETSETPVNPDTSHLSMGDVGETIPHLPDDAEPLEVDTSSLDLAPEGSDVLDAQYRKREDAAAPSTDHLSLEN